MHGRFIVLFLCVTCVFLPKDSVLEANPTTVFLTRHAERADPPAPSCTPRNCPGGSDPCLSAAGKVRAQQLAHVLQKAQVEAIYSTSCNRTWETAQPLAQALGLPIQTYQNVPALAARVRADHAGQQVYIASHSGTVEAIITALGGDGSACPILNEFDNLCVVSIEGPNQVKVVNLQYGRGDPIDLVVDSLRHHPATPKSTDSVRFTVVVKNSGRDRAVPSTMSLCIGRVGRRSLCSTYAVGALTAGETEQFVRNQRLTVAGRYHISATVDVDDTIMESNEGNNQRTENLTVIRTGCRPGDERYVRCRIGAQWGFRRDTCVNGTWRTGRCQAGEIP